MGGRIVCLAWLVLAMSSLSMCTTGVDEIPSTIPMGPPGVIVVYPPEATESLGDLATETLLSTTGPSIDFALTDLVLLPEYAPLVAVKDKELGLHIEEVGLSFPTPSTIALGLALTDTSWDLELTSYEDEGLLITCYAEVDSSGIDIQATFDVTALDEGPTVVEVTIEDIAVTIAPECPIKAQPEVSMLLHQTLLALLQTRLAEEAVELEPTVAHLVTPVGLGASATTYAGTADDDGHLALALGRPVPLEAPLSADLEGSLAVALPFGISVDPIEPVSWWFGAAGVTPFVQTLPPDACVAHLLVPLSTVRHVVRGSIAAGSMFRSSKPLPKAIGAAHLPSLDEIGASGTLELTYVPVDPPEVAKSGDDLVVTLPRGSVQLSTHIAGIRLTAAWFHGIQATASVVMTITDEGTALLDVESISTTWDALDAPLGQVVDPEGLLEEALTTALEDSLSLLPSPALLMGSGLVPTAATIHEGHLAICLE